MKKLLVFVGVVAFAAPLAAGNLLINPEFDETPWDSAWTIDTTGHGTWGNGTAERDLSKWHSSPQSCKMYAGGVAAYARVYQEVEETANCTCSVYYQYHLEATGAGWVTIMIFVKVNNRWIKEWEEMVSGDASDEVLVWTKWEKIYSSADTVSGIKFKCLAGGDMSTWGEGTFWVDDVYVSYTVGIEEESEAKGLKLSAYPNPFISSTKIEYELPKATNVSIAIYNLSGQKVATLVDENKKAGCYTISWDGTDDRDKKVATGIYFYRMEADKFKATRKLTILK